MAKTRRVSKARKTPVDRAAERPLRPASELRELRAEATLADIAGGDDWGGGFGDFGGFDAGWGFDSFDSGWDPFATDPFATDPFATDPFATDPFATDPFATDPFATDPFATGPSTTDPFATNPFPADPFSGPLTTDPGAMGPFIADPGTAGFSDPSAVGPVITDTGAALTDDPSAMGPFIADPAATVTTTDPGDGGGDATPLGTWYDSGDGGSYFVPADATPVDGTTGPATTAVPELRPDAAEPPFGHAGEDAGEMGPFPTDDSPHEELPVAVLDTGTAPPMSGGPDLGGGNDDGDFLSPVYDANGGSTYTWGPEDPATTGPVDDNEPPPGQLSFDPAATLAAAQDLANEPEPFNPEREPRSEANGSDVMEGVAPGGFGIPGANFGEGEPQQDASTEGGWYDSPDLGADLTGGFWTADPGGAGNPIAGPDVGPAPEGGGQPDFGTPAAPVYDVDNGGGTYAEPVTSEPAGGASNGQDLGGGEAPPATSDTIGGTAGVEAAAGLEGDAQQGYRVETEGGFVPAAQPTTGPSASDATSTTRGVGAQVGAPEPAAVAAVPEVPLPAPVDGGPTPASDPVGTPTPTAPTTQTPEAPPLTAQQQYELDVYKLQNEGNATLEQGQAPDCSIVSVVRQLGATPEGNAFLEGITKDLGDGFWQVTTVGPDGQAQVQTVWLHPDEIFGVGDPRAMAVEKAVVYNMQAAVGDLPMRGITVGDAMGQLGISNVTWSGPQDALSVGLGNQIVVTQTSGETGPLPYGLLPGHAYVVAGTLVAPDGTLMVVLSNPHGDGNPNINSQPLPIPADLLGTALLGTTTGTLFPNP